MTATSVNNKRLYFVENYGILVFLFTSIVLDRCRNFSLRPSKYEYIQLEVLEVIELQNNDILKIAFEINNKLLTFYSNLSVITLKTQWY